MAASMLTQTELKEELHYNPETGLFSRIVDKRYGRHGVEAGGINSKGYRVIKIGIKAYKAHRLAWFYIKGEWPSDQIDHANGIKEDNRYANLREANNSQNMQNKGANKKNISGLKGVSHDPRRIKNKWMARASINGDVKSLGYFKTPELAANAYKLFAKNNHGEFYKES